MALAECEELTKSTILGPCLHSKDPLKKSIFLFVWSRAFLCSDVFFKSSKLAQKSIDIDVYTGSVYARPVGGSVTSVCTQHKRAHPCTEK